MKQIYFVTGTDTGVGKTMISAALLAGFLRSGNRVRYFKPVQTGVAHGEHDDAAWVMKHTGVPEGAVLLPVYRLALPASPDCAARHEGITIEFGRLLEAVHAHAAETDVLIVEGAGGLLVPIDAGHTILDLINATKASPVVVTRLRLGTLNHTALTLRELRRAKCSPRVLVMNDADAPGDANDRIVRDDNRKQLPAMAHPQPAIYMAYAATISRAAIQKCGDLLVAALKGSHAQEI